MTATIMTQRKLSTRRKKIHIDVECDEVPIFINNLNVNMEKFFGHGQVIAPKEFLEKIAVIDVEKL